LIASFDPSKADLSKVDLVSLPSHNELRTFICGVVLVDRDAFLVLGAQMLAGGSAFLLTLKSSQLLQGMVRVSSSTRVVAPFFGFGTVITGSILAGFAADITHRVAEVGIEPVVAEPPVFSATPAECARFSVVGLVTFYLLGGRFSSIAPSDLAKLGAFSHLRRSMAAAGEAYATAGSRNAMRIYGKQLSA
jgi:hypothetical protein